MAFALLVNKLDLFTFSMHISGLIVHNLSVNVISKFLKKARLFFVIFDQIKYVFLVSVF